MKPKIAQNSPIAVELEAEKTVYWCSCGLSVKQPYCDGSHKGTSFVPTAFTAEKTATYYFCGCKHSGKGALCDGAHLKL